jgi:hypothetical protein
VVRCLYSNLYKSYDLLVILWKFHTGLDVQFLVWQPVLDGSTHLASAVEFTAVGLDKVSTISIMFFRRRETGLILLVDGSFSCHQLHRSENETSITYRAPFLAPLAPLYGPKSFCPILAFLANCLRLQSVTPDSRSHLRL